jgi:phage terminase large subunit
MHAAQPNPFAPVDAQFPEKIFRAVYQFDPITDAPILLPGGGPKHRPSRYKVFWGGRGGAKSWGIARWLLIEGTKRPLQILCVRELQTSIRDSVYKLLRQQIEKLGLETFYDVQANVIKGLNGTEFTFEGIRHNTSKIKSYEGADFCWVEEAQALSESSWEVLVPTIRKPGSEIIVTFNPDLETDATAQKFLKACPPNSIIVNINWRDNPWFDETELPAELQELKARNYDSYLHVWEGQFKKNLEGSVYADEIRDATVQKRIRIKAEGGVPYDRAFPVCCSFDLGRSDHTSIWFFQRVGFEFHIIDFYQNRLKYIDHYIGVLQSRGYIYGMIWLPHDAKAKTLGTKLTIEEQMRAKFSQVRVLQRVSEKDLINAARTVFPNCYFDDSKCAEGLHALRHYRYEVDAKTKQFSQHPMHDEHSDAAKSFEYFALSSKQGSGRTRLNLNDIVKRAGRFVGQEEFDSTPAFNPTSWLGR